MLELLIGLMKYERTCSTFLVAAKIERTTRILFMYVLVVCFVS